MSVEAGPIEYATTADGMSIAHQRFGSGPPVLRFPTLPLVLRVIPTIIETMSITALSPARSVLTWDPRGVGMSERSVIDFSLDASMADAIAVAESVGHPLPVYASVRQGPAALVLAARRPDLVSHLILSATGASGAELVQSPSTRALMALADVDFGILLDHVIRATLQIQEPVASGALEIISNEVDRDTVRAYWADMTAHDARDVLSAIAVPTLIIESRQNAATLEYHSDGRELSRKIHGARLVIPRSRDETKTAILTFLDVEEARPHGAFRTIMFTDLVASTALTQHVGDDAAQQVVETHDAGVQAALAAHGGVQVKHTGDGIMAAFDSATEAARAGRQIATSLTSQGVGVRVGLNAGEPIERDGDLFGTAVQLAARVGDAAGDGQVLATQVVRDLTAGKGLVWSAVGALDAKGFDDPISVFALDLD